MTEPQRFRMYIDDTGEVDAAATNDLTRRFAGITGVIFNLSYVQKTFDNSFNKLKEKHFGIMDKTGRPPVLHRRVLLGRSGPFACLADKTKRDSWNKDCLRMYDVAEYTVITVGVDKISYYHDHPKWNGSFYDLLVGNAIERYFYFLRGRGIGDVVAEALSGDHDRSLKDLYKKFYNTGTDHIPANLLQPVMSSKEIKIEPKSAGVPGVQMADLLAKPMLAHCLETYTTFQQEGGFWQTVAKIVADKKLYCDSRGRPDGYGRVWRPQRRSGPT